MEAIGLFEGGKMLPEALAVIGKASRSGKPRPGPDNDCVRRLQLMLQPGDGIQAVFGRVVRRILEIH